MQSSALMGVGWGGVGGCAVKVRKRMKYDPRGLIGVTDFCVWWFVRHQSPAQQLIILSDKMLFPWKVIMVTSSQSITKKGCRIYLNSDITVALTQWKNCTLVSPEQDVL